MTKHEAVEIAGSKWSLGSLGVVVGVLGTLFTIWITSQASAKEDGKVEATHEVRITAIEDKVLVNAQSILRMSDRFDDANKEMRSLILKENQSVEGKVDRLGDKLDKFMLRFMANGGME